MHAQLFRRLAITAALVGAATIPLRAGGDMPADSFYSLQSKTLQGQPADLSEYKGKVTLVVNVASQCGHTPQYEGLQKLHEELKDRGFSVLGFPSNDFGQQEPGTPEEIATFCQKNYGVTFPMFHKVVTKEGPEQSPEYDLLGRGGSLPGWNFAKYVVAKDGRIVQFFPHKVKPEAEELRAVIEAELKK